MKRMFLESLIFVNKPCLPFQHLTYSKHIAGASTVFSVVLSGILLIAFFTLSVFMPDCRCAECQYVQCAYAEYCHGCAKGGYAGSDYTYAYCR